jgi:hypothetical protein
MIWSLSIQLDPVPSSLKSARYNSLHAQQAFRFQVEAESFRTKKDLQAPMIPVRNQDGALFNL